MRTWRSAALITAVGLLIVTLANLGYVPTRAEGSPGSRGAPAPSPTASYDSGGLRVTPVTAAVTPVIGEEAAARMLASTWLPGSGSVPAVLASVVIDVPPTTVKDIPLAWVYAVHVPVDLGPCAGSPRPIGLPEPSATPSGAPSHLAAVIVDATTGQGYRYSGAFADECGSNPVPELTGTDVQLSIPFTVVRAGPPQSLVTFQLPPCGTLADATYGAHPVATATVPLTRCDEPARTVSEAGSGQVVVGPHAPVGLLCAGHFDARYGEPADCVHLPS